MAGEDTQAQININYNFHSLGWEQFQDLCAAVLSAALGQNVQSFARTRDGGRDGGFSGTWDPSRGGVRGSGLLQCKFSAVPGSLLQPSDMEDEVEKATALAAKGLAQNYILVTNCGYSGRTDETLKDRFEAIPGIESFQAYGRDWLTRQINEKPELRMLVPRVYGLGDLTQILDARRRAQADEILAYMGNDLGKLVLTDAYYDSVGALSEHGFVLLLGAPASGKTTIAAGLAIGSIDRWHCVPIRITSGQEFRDAWNPNERQFFWVDDAFGATQYQSQKIDDWNQTFPFMLTALHTGAKIVFTSRGYVFERAERELKISAFPPLRESRVRIHVEEYSSREREAILYNHLRFGTQPQQFRQRLFETGLLHNVAAHPRFSPIVAKRLGNPAFTQTLELTPDGLDSYVEDQARFVIDTLETLDAPSYGALSLIFINGGAVEAPLAVDDDQTKLLTLIGTDGASASMAMTAMKGDFVKLVPRDGSLFWRFDHPSIGDALTTILSRDIERLDIYLMGAPVERLLDEVACVGSPIRGAVEVPASRHSTLRLRLKEVRDRYKLYSFLYERADPSFLRTYLAENPKFATEVADVAYSAYNRQSQLLVRLYRLGLIDNTARATAVAAIRSDAIDDLNTAFIRSNAGGLLTDAEVSALIAELRQDAIPNLHEYISAVEDSYSAPDDPETHFSDIEGSILTLQEVFEDDDEAQELLDNAIEEIHIRVEALNEELPSEADDRPDDYDRDDHISENDVDDLDRDFFDDVAAPN